MMGEFRLSNQKNYDGQRRRRHGDAPRREEEGKGEKEGCAGEQTEREKEEEKRALEARDEGCEWLDGDLRAGGAEEEQRSKGAT